MTFLFDSLAAGVGSRTEVPARLRTPVAADRAAEAGGAVARPVHRRLSQVLHGRGGGALQAARHTKGRGGFAICMLKKKKKVEDFEEEA